MDTDLGNLSFQMLIIIQVISCIVLADGCRRLYVLINNNTPTGTNNRAVIMHVGVYILYLLSLLYFYLCFYRNVGKIGEKRFTI